MVQKKVEDLEPYDYFQYGMYVYQKVNDWNLANPNHGEDRIYCLNVGIIDEEGDFHPRNNWYEMGFKPTLQVTLIKLAVKPL